MGIRGSAGAEENGACGSRSTIYLCSMSMLAIKAMSLNEQ